MLRRMSPRIRGDTFLYSFPKYDNCSLAPPPSSEPVLTCASDVETASLSAKATSLQRSHSVSVSEDSMDESDSILEDSSVADGCDEVEEPLDCDDGGGDDDDGEE